MWMALTAMLAQLFFSTAHMAALAATISGPVSLTGTPSGSLGFLEICSANGLLRVTPEGLIPKPIKNDSDPTSQCPVCLSAAIGAFANITIHAELLTDYAELALPVIRPQLVEAGFCVSAGVIRAPPKA